MCKLKLFLEKWLNDVENFLFDLFFFSLSVLNFLGIEGLSCRRKKCISIEINICVVLEKSFLEN